MKPDFKIKSAAETPPLPLLVAESKPSRAWGVSKQFVGPVVRMKRGEVLAARKEEAAIGRGIQVRASVWLQSIALWQRGGINE